MKLNNWSYIEVQGAPAFGIDPTTGTKSLRVFSSDLEAEAFFQAVNRRDELRSIDDPLSLTRQALRNNILRFEIDPGLTGPKGSLPITYLAKFVAGLASETVDAYGGYEKGAPPLAPDLAFAVLKLKTKGYVAVRHETFGSVAAVFSCPGAAAAFASAQLPEGPVEVRCLPSGEIPEFVRLCKNFGLLQFVIDPGVGAPDGPAFYLDDLLT